MATNDRGIMSDKEFTASLKSRKPRIKDKSTGKKYAFDGALTDQTIFSAMVHLASQRGAEAVKVTLPKIEGAVVVVTDGGKCNGRDAMEQLASHEGFSADEIALINGIVQYGSAEKYAAELARVKAEKESAELARVALEAQQQAEREDIAKEAKAKAERDAQKNGKGASKPVPATVS